MSFRGLAPLPEQLSGVRYLFTDIDDTLTTEGRLLPQTYQALWDLHAAGIAIVPVTGGSAGWCEHIVRAWPVAAVIGESGAFAMTLKNGQVETEFWEGEARRGEPGSATDPTSQGDRTAPWLLQPVAGPALPPRRYCYRDRRTQPTGHRRPGRRHPLYRWICRHQLHPYQHLDGQVQQTNHE